MDLVQSELIKYDNQLLVINNTEAIQAKYLPTRIVAMEVGKLGDMVEVVVVNYYDFNNGQTE